jgi:hypothetical protein
LHARPACAMLRATALRDRSMTNTIAFWLALIIAGVFAADLFFFDWDLHIVLGRHVLRLIEWVAFWR